MFENIPIELKQLNQWVVWGVDKDNLKCPYNPITMKRAGAGQPNTWGKYYEAVNRVKCGQAQGVGFEFNNNGYVGVDLDTVRNPETGFIADDAINIIKLLNSYTEISPSGYGFHIICKGDLDIIRNKAKLPPNGIIRIDSQTGKQKEPEIEMYKAGRYFTMTGNLFKAVRS